MSTMEASLVLFVGDRFQWGLREVSFGFAYIGLIIVLSQGFLVRKLLPKLGEKKMLAAGLVMMILGFGMITFSYSIAVLAVAMTLVAFGNSFSIHQPWAASVCYHQVRNKALCWVRLRARHLWVESLAQLWVDFFMASVFRHFY
jgi:MFS family permease